MFFFNETLTYDEYSNNINPDPLTNSFMQDSVNSLLHEEKYSDPIQRVESDKSEFEGGESDSEEEKKHNTPKNAKANRVKVSS